jgi:hypothetical protein
VCTRARKCTRLPRFVVARIVTNGDIPTHRFTSAFPIARNVANRGAIETNTRFSSSARSASNLDTRFKYVITRLVVSARIVANRGATECSTRIFCSARSASNLDARCVYKTTGIVCSARSVANRGATELVTRRSCSARSASNLDARCGYTNTRTGFSARFVANRGATESITRIGSSARITPDSLDVVAQIAATVFTKTTACSQFALIKQSF